jgi:hypothetical protein
MWFSAECPVYSDHNGIDRLAERCSKECNFELQPGNRRDSRSWKRSNVWWPCGDVHRRILKRLNVNSTCMDRILLIIIIIYASQPHFPLLTPSKPFLRTLPFPLFLLLGLVIAGRSTGRTTNPCVSSSISIRYCPGIWDARCIGDSRSSIVERSRYSLEAGCLALKINKQTATWRTQKPSSGSTDELLFIRRDGISFHTHWRSQQDWSERLRWWEKPGCDRIAIALDWIPQILQLYKITCWSHGSQLKALSSPETNLNDAHCITTSVRYSGHTTVQHH